MNISYDELEWDGRMLFTRAYNVGITALTSLENAIDSAKAVCSSIPAYQSSSDKDLCDRVIEFGVRVAWSLTGRKPN